MSKANDLARQVDMKRKTDPHQTFSFASWVSRDRRYLYVGVGKNACTRIKATLVLLEGKQLPGDLGKVHDMGDRLADFSTEEIVTILTSPEWLRFCFVRNPYYRLFSAYKSKILNYLDLQYQWVRDEIRDSCGYPVRGGKRAGVVAFRDYVSFVEARLDSIPDAHWSRQADILTNDLIQYDIVGRFESFVQDFESVLQRLQAPDGVMATLTEVMNPTTPIYHAAVYDRELADRVYRMYEADFRAFGYDRDSWLFDYDWKAEQGNTLDRD